MKNFLFYILLFIAMMILLKIFYRLFVLFWQFFVYQKKDFPNRYGKGSYVLITGASRGQGREFALQFAQSGMNLILIGSERMEQVENTIHANYPDVHVVLYKTDFSNAFEETFFDPIEQLFQKYDISVVVNNVGYRTGCLKYEDMPRSEIKKCLAVCTMVQCTLTQMAIANFKERKTQCAIINITSQCSHPTDLFTMSPEISLPYLSVYEASKAFDFYHSNSVHKELQERFTHIDYLTVTPGAVITETTEPMLSSTAFSISDTKFVSNVLTVLGNKNGVVYGSLGHGLSGILINIFPFGKDRILRQTSRKIALKQEERILLIQNKKT